MKLSPTQPLPKARYRPGDTIPPTTAPAGVPRRGRVAILTGCAQQVLRPTINEAAIRLLTAHGVEVVLLDDPGCVRMMSDFIAANPALWNEDIGEDGE